LGVELNSSRDNNNNNNMFVGFVCSLVGIKLKKLYSASCGGREVNPLGVVTHRPEAQTTCVPKKLVQTTYISNYG